MKYAIQTKNLCKQYKDVKNVNELNLNVPSQCVYGFLGPNGAGKSTTMKMLLGLIKPTQGSMRILGKTFDEKNRLSLLSQTGSLIESPSYYGHLTGCENMRIVASLKGASEKEIDHFLHLVHLDSAKDKKVKHYSLGMKQRLGIACALLGNPRLILLDEPTNGLDPAGIQEIRELIKSLPINHGITVFVSSHLLSEIDQMASHIGIIDHGELLFENSLHVLHEKSSEQLLIKTTDQERALSLLHSRSITCSQMHNDLDPSQNRICLPMLCDHDLTSLTHYLTESNIELLRIEESKKSLEDIFLDITGRSICLS